MYAKCTEMILDHYTEIGVYIKKMKSYCHNQKSNVPTRKLQTHVLKFVLKSTLPWDHNFDVFHIGVKKVDSAVFLA